MHMRKFNFSPFVYEPSVFAMAFFIDWLNRQLNALSQAVGGAVVRNAGNSGSEKTIEVQVADLTAVLLTNNVTLTLSMEKARKGHSGDIEFTQDEIGGRTVTFVNLVNTAPSITSTLSKRTLVRFTHVGDGWVATTLASNY